MHFRHISAKIQPKILNVFIIISYKCEATFWLGGPGPSGPTLWLRPCVAHVIVSLGKALYDDYLCLVVSKKQQIQW